MFICTERERGQKLWEGKRGTHRGAISGTKSSRVDEVKCNTKRSALQGDKRERTGSNKFNE